MSRYPHVQLPAGRGKSSRKLLQQFSRLNKECWGRHFWPRYFFLATSGVVTDEAIMEYIGTRTVERQGEDFRVEDE